VITESVSPQVLWPPNGKLVPVHVSGNISDNVATVNSVQYNVQDSETGGQILSGPVMLGQDGHYSFRIRLQARRAGQDLNGRQYTINVIASDTQGNSNNDSAVVIVPHDRGHRNGGSGAGGAAGGPDVSGRFGGRGSRQHGSGSGSGLGASNRLHFGGPGEGQQNSISVPGSNNTVTQNVTNNQSNTYNFNNSFNTTVTNPPAPVTNPTPTPVPINNGGDQGDQGDQGDGSGHDHGNGDSGDQGQGHGNGNGSDNGNGNGHDKHGGD